MTGGRQTNAGNPKDWLDFAADDLAAAKVLIDNQTAYMAQLRNTIG